MTESGMTESGMTGSRTSELAPSGFTNVRDKSWHQKGFFVSQTAYVALALVVIVAIMSVVSHNFLTVGNLGNIGKNFSFVAIVTLGITVVIITGGIDLSVGSTMALSAIICAMTLSSLAGTAATAVPGLSMVLAVIAALAVSALIGAANGVLIAKVGLSPFVTTLGMLSVVRGLAFAITQGRGQTPRGPDVGLFYKITDGTLLGLPVAMVYLLALAAILGVVLHHTAWGRYVFALGGNERAAQLTGVPVDRIKIGVYVLCSMLAGLSGVLMTGWLGSAPANLATGYELTIIAAAVIGGANLAGGLGGPTGAVIGALLIEVIRNGLVLAGIDAYWQIVLVGCIIILAVVVDRVRTKRAL